MNKSKKSKLQTRIPLIAAQIAAQVMMMGSGRSAYAQFEENFQPPPDFGDDQSNAFPRPPSDNSNFPAPDAAAKALNNFGSSTGSASGRGGFNSGAGAGKNGKDVMNKAQKDKFNHAGPEDLTAANFPETIESFDFPNVEISDVIKAISELTGKNFIVDPGVRGKITIIAPSKLTVAEAYKAFLSALAINGYTVVPSGSFLKIKSARNAQRDSIETYSGAYYPNSDQMITRIIHLKHISAEQVNRDLRILASKDGEMSIYSPTNSIILSDYGSNIDRVMKIINQLDVPGFEEQIEVIKIKYARSKDIADLVDKIVNKGQKSNNNNGLGGFTAGVPRFSRNTGTSGQSGGSVFSAFPDDRTNSIIAVGNKAGIDRLKKLISQLDFGIRPEDSGGVFVYYVKNGDAEKIAQVLTGVAKDAAPKPAAGTNSPPSFLPAIPAATTEKGQGGADIFGGDVKITADKATNSLVIVASKQDYDTVMNLLAKIDIPRDQVYVEAVIMEMAANDNNSNGVAYYKYGPDGAGKTGFNSGLDITSDFLSPVGGSGAILSFAGGDTVKITDPSTSKTISIPSLVGLMEFLKSTGKANILSTPQLMVMDNQEGEIEVGDKVATAVNVSTSATGQQTASPTFEDATIKLNIKPFISPANEAIRMEIKQSVKQIGANNQSTPKAISDNSQPLATRNIKTSIVVNNGDTAVLGGLIRDQQTESVTKVPLLGDLPIIGWLFKGSKTSKSKVNLLVFLTPKIIRNPGDQRTILGNKLDERLEFIKTSGGKDPYGQAVDSLSRRLSNDSGKRNETAVEKKKE